MRGEWQQRQSTETETSGAPARSSSWSWARGVAAGAVMAMAAFVVGVGLGELSSSEGTFGTAPVAAVSDEAVPTEIGDAVAAVRRGSDEPAPTEHLSVVAVSVNVCGERSIGTGVVVADGLLLTAAHVVGDAGLVRVDHRGVTVTGEVLGVLADGRDIALVEVDAPMAVPLEVHPVPGPGEPLTLVGHPDGGPRTVVVGARTEVAPAVAAAVAGDPIGVDAPTGSGFSGGPALDAAGRLVGIVVATETATDTALVVGLADLGRLDETAVVEGRCPTDA